MANEVKKITMSQALANRGVIELGNSLSLTPEQVNRAKSTALQLSSDPKLKDCDPMSLIKYCFETARYNFTRDDCVYPVPYGGKIQTQLSYKGFRELCLASNAYRDVNVSKVYNCDKVLRNRETGKLIVEFEEDYSKTINAKEIGYFAYAIDSNGEMTNSLFMTNEEIKEHGRKYSRSYGGLWTTNFEAMARKTVIKRLCTELRTTPLLEEAKKQDQVVHTSIDSDEYLDNPLNKDKKTTVTNSIIEDTGEVIDVEENDAEDLPFGN